jgi:hypothetical protein
MERLFQRTNRLLNNRYILSRLCLYVRAYGAVASNTAIASP